MEVIIIVLTIVSAILLAIFLDQGNGKRHKPHLPKAPAPKHVSEENPKKDISEPVISFVKFLKENPENFLWKTKEPCYENNRIERTFKLIDRVNRKVYTYSIIDCMCYSDYLSVKPVNFLTDDEREYLLEAHKWGMEYLEAKEEVKRKARDLAEREEYKKIYCKGK